MNDGCSLPIIEGGDAGVTQFPSFCGLNGRKTSVGN